jgi:hypothetical protein
MATAPRTQQAQFLQRRLARRAGGSNITRLAQDYTRQIGDLTSQYETEFTRYQDMVAQQMAPFQEAMSQFQTQAMPGFEAELTQYQQKFDAYQAELAAIAADPVTERVERMKVGRTWYGKSKYADVTFFDPKEIPTFDAQAPVAPDAPTAPQIDEFDSSQFDQRRGQLQEGFQRDIAARKGARISAVRRSSRTMLSGAE